MSETDSSPYVLLHKLGIWQRASFSNSQIFCSGTFSVVIYSNMHTVGMHFSVATHGMQSKVYGLTYITHAIVCIPYSPFF